jgi:hypothetical protein
LFKIFFPEETPYTATRYRAHDAAKYLTKAESSDPNADASNPFGYKKNVQPDQETDFKSWDDLYGPHDTLGSPSSSLLANFNYTALSSTSFPINGYGSIALDPKKALFPAENIAIVSCFHAQSFKTPHGTNQNKTTAYKWRMRLDLRPLPQIDETPRRSHHRIRRST